ncbi:MAG: guanylate kinase [Rikenellaceae bacterium]
MSHKKVLIISAPSGAGKSTLISYLLSKFDNLEFSISATSRSPRGQEVDGRDYYFISREEFADRVSKGEFLEWEEVYNGSCYGTLRSEIERIWNRGNIVVFDVDVVGGTNLKRLLPDNSLSIFIDPPSVEHLRRRLIGRGTDDEQAIEKRLAKAEKELTYKGEFDVAIVNDDLTKAEQEIEETVKKFING